ncbi:MAG: hypothetical protein KGL39_45955, partial [Patescibacteria group bacterium]|nr:hypothetical protein [Patescibacteria group bacterium]
MSLNESIDGLLDVHGVCEMLGLKHRRHSQSVGHLRQTYPDFPSPVKKGGYHGTKNFWDAEEIRLWDERRKNLRPEGDWLDTAETLAALCVTRATLALEPYASLPRTANRGRVFYARAEIQALIDGLGLQPKEGADLVNLKQASERLGLTRERLRQISLKPNFPPPRGHHGLIKLYDFAEVEHFYREVLPRQSRAAMQAGVAKSHEKRSALAVEAIHEKPR